MPSPCPACGVVAEESFAFCEGCGADLGAANPAPQVVAATAVESTPATEFLPGEGKSNVVSTVATCASCGEGPISDGYCDVCGARQPDPRDHFEETPAEWVAGVCDKGIVHARNEDGMSTAAASQAGSFAALVVCDGVTTAPLSEKASLAAAQAANAVLVEASHAANVDWHDALKRSCVAAQAQAVAVAESLGQPLNPPSCTFVAGVVVGGVFHTGWCGDSRAYWLPDTGEALIVSIDDSIASQMIASGRPRAEAEADSRAHTITRWLGADSPDPTALTMSTPLSSPGWALVVSDGMWNYVSAAEDLRKLVHSYSEEESTPLSIAKKMVGFANEQGGHDNITVAIARVEPARATEPSSPAAASEPTVTTPTLESTEPLTPPPIPSTPTP